MEELESERSTTPGSYAGVVAKSAPSTPDTRDFVPRSIEPKEKTGTISAEKYVSSPRPEGLVKPAEESELSAAPRPVGQTNLGVSSVASTSARVDTQQKPWACIEDCLSLLWLYEKVRETDLHPIRRMHDRTGIGQS